MEPNHNEVNYLFIKCIALTVAKARGVSETILILSSIENIWDL